ncbi:hypothetical protein [Dactylosporangium sp. NPDC049140]|uniref:hypothetical protein n=1 Tax=Dactylosporangium sp. NPDC049140 TaxID=3155647 RepID=UPI0033D0CEC8
MGLDGGRLTRRLLPVAGALAGLIAAFLVMQAITTNAFERLEARQVAQDAELGVQFVDPDPGTIARINDYIRALIGPGGG